MRIRGPILNPRADRTVEFIADGALVGDDRGRIIGVGTWSRLGASHFDFEPSGGIICPAFFDNHIHIPQHPIRGRFMEGVEANPPHGRLIAGLNRNVFPAEAKCADLDYARQVLHDFIGDTLAHGVIGGAAYMTVHIAAARAALEMLSGTWSVGPVLMNMNCPEYLRTDELTWQREVEELAREFGRRRVIVTDRFAVAVDSRLRREAVALAKRLGLRMQTHLNEQPAEKRFVEQTLYPDANTYTGVYERDGLLDRDPILAHCVRMSMEEFTCVSRHPGADIAHCPTSNTLLGSGVMPLDQLVRNGIDYAVCTDVGASPTTSLLCEMAQFLKVHADSSKYATPQEALYRTTLGAAKMLGLDRELGSFEVGKAMTFCEIAYDGADVSKLAADEVIRSKVLEMSPAEPSRELRHAIRRLRDAGVDSGPDLSLLESDVAATKTRLDRKIRRVFVEGRPVFP
jgi:guanine deaminase